MQEQSFLAIVKYKRYPSKHRRTSPTQEPVVSAAPPTQAPPTPVLRQPSALPMPEASPAPPVCKRTIIVGRYFMFDGSAAHAQHA